MPVNGFKENKCKEEVYTTEEVDGKLSGKSNTGHTHTMANITDLGTISSHNYSRGTAAPSGGSDGDVYDQYF